MKIVYSKRFLEHRTGEGHPESPARLKAVMDFLKSENVFNKHEVDLIPPARVSDADLECVHSPAYLQELKLLSARESRVSGDNPFHKNTFEIALLAAGAALAAARAAVEEKERRFAFSLARPPGHHAGRARFSGFCYLNNAAFAVKKIMAEKGFKKAFVVDFDLHCGDGSEEIFWDDASVFYYSIHQDPRTIFPYAHGFEDEGNEHVRNVCLQPLQSQPEAGDGDEVFLKRLRETLEPAFKKFKPDVVAASAGFDSFHADAAVGGRLGVRKSETFFEVGETIRRLAGGKPVFGVLEGGYFLPKLGENVWSFLKAFI